MQRGSIIDAWKRWRFPVSQIESGNSAQWSIALLLRCTALMAILFALVFRSSATVTIDWLWIGKFLLVMALPIFIGRFCCSVWRDSFSQVGSFKNATRIWLYVVLSSTFVFVVASVIASAYFCYYYLGRGFQWIDMSTIAYCFWHNHRICFFVFGDPLSNTSAASHICIRATVATDRE